MGNKLRVVINSLLRLCKDHIKGHWLCTQNKHLTYQRTGVVLGKWPTDISPLKTADRHLTQLAFGILPAA